MVRKVELVILIAFFGIKSAGFADQITLKNGGSLDWYRREVGRQDAGAAHRVRGRRDGADFGAITQITTDKELHVTTSDKKTVVGPVTTSDGKIEVATKTDGAVEVPTENVAMIRNDAEQTAYDKSLHPGLLHGWNGGANVGFSVARGNSQTSNLALAINAVHATLSDKITIYSTSSRPTTSWQLRVRWRIWSRLEFVTIGILTRVTFAFVGADFMSNALQDLDLRGVYGGGLGYHAIKSDNTTLDLLAGLNYTHETYSNGAVNTPVTVPPTYVSYGVTNRFAALTLGEELDAQGREEYGDHGEALPLSGPVERYTASIGGSSTWAR